VGTIYVREVVRRWSVLLQDISPQFTRHAESEAIDWLNDAQRAIFKYLPAACSQFLTVRLKPGTLQAIENLQVSDVKFEDGTSPALPMVGSQLLDVLCNMGTAGTTPGKAVRALVDGRDLLDTLYPNWHAETGAEPVNYLYDPKTPRHFHVWPGVPAGRVWVRLSMVAEPLLIAGDPGDFAADGADTTTISVHDEHIDDLVNYMTARALMKNAQGNRATGMEPNAYIALFTGSINAKSQALMNFNPNLKHLPFASAPLGAAS
jgi:hypothetical protein